jgi:hypothetical protein
MGSAETQKGLESRHWLPSAIVPENKLVQVDLDLTATDPVVSAHEPLLQVPDGAIRQWDYRLGATAQFGPEQLGAGNVLETDALKTAEALEAIGIDRGTGSNVPGAEALDGRRPEVRDDGHAKASRGPTALLYRYQNQSGPAPLELATTSETCLGTAHPRFIHLDLSPKGFASHVHGRSPELVENHPSGLITLKSELTLEKQRRNASLVGRHQVGGPEPQGQGSLRIVKDSSRGERDLVPAGGTLPAPPSHQSIATRVGASRTLEAFGPAAGGQVLLTGFLRGEL